MRSAPSFVRRATNNCVTTGEATINALDLDYISISGCAGVLVGYIVLCRFIAYLGIRYLKW